MKIYTKTGDSGKTGLIGGRRVGKGDALIGVLGCLDELGAILGMCRAEIGLEERNSAEYEAVRRVVAQVQDDLMVMGAVLAGGRGLRKLSVEQLEKEIDKVNERLPELKQFILAGGGRVGALLHFARAVCRRCEREMVKLGRSSDSAIKGTNEKSAGGITIFAPEFLAYLNRLSVLLFVLARWVIFLDGAVEERWGGGRD